MTPQNVEAAIAIMKAHNIPEPQAMEILALVATKLHDEKTIAKAQRTGLTVDEVRGMDTGREVGAAINKRYGFGRKS